MDNALMETGQTSRTALSGMPRLKRSMTILVARCASRSWLVLVAMPVAVVVCALA